MYHAYQIPMCYNEIGWCAQNMLINLAIINQYHNWVIKDTINGDILVTIV
jgi:hypothetical protein